MKKKPALHRPLLFFSVLLYGLLSLNALGEWDESCRLVIMAIISETDPDALSFWISVACDLGC
ncbi:hypothetical protein APED_02390 [Acanthopleuribacter pedis]